MNSNFRDLDVLDTLIRDLSVTDSAFFFNLVACIPWSPRHHEDMYDDIEQEYFP